MLKTRVRFPSPAPASLLLSADSLRKTPPSRRSSSCHGLFVVRFLCFSSDHHHGKTRTHARRARSAQEPSHPQLRHAPRPHFGRPKARARGNLPALSDRIPSRNARFHGGLRARSRHGSRNRLRHGRDDGRHRGRASGGEFPRLRSLRRGRGRARQAPRRNGARERAHRPPRRR